MFLKTWQENSEMLSSLDDIVADYGKYPDEHYYELKEMDAVALSATIEAMREQKRVSAAATKIRNGL